MQKISIIIPSYNEAANIRPLYDEIIIALSGKEEYLYELIFIDDGSEDDTLDVIKDLTLIDNRIFYIELSRNFGHQYAIKAGLDLSTGDAIITMDCDLQHPPAVINDLIKKWKEGYDIVYTRRKDHQNISWFKRTTSDLFYQFLHWASDLNLEKGTADFRLINRNVINAFKGFKENELFIRGLVKWAGFRQTALDYSPNSRYSGKTKYSFKKMLSFAVRGITAFSIRPLKYIAYIGLLMFILSIILIPYALISYSLGQAVPGWTSLIISVIFFGSLQLFMLGIIGLYLSKIVIQSTHRPQYLIRDTNYQKQVQNESIG